MRFLLVAALLLQEPDLEWSAEEEYREAIRGSGLAMLTLIAHYQDGTPVRGHIQCSGNWYKHQDQEPDFTGPSLPFETDARGAIIMNPHLEDAWVLCWSEQGNYHGRVMVEFSEEHPTGVYEIVMERAVDGE